MAHCGVHDRSNIKSNFSLKRIPTILWHFCQWGLHGRFDKIAYALHTRYNGLDFTAVSIGALGLSPARSAQHSPSGGADLSRVLTSLGISPSSTALDLGCGKGAAVLTMARFPFVEVVGVDLSVELVEVAKANAVRLRQDKVRFVCSDAATFLDVGRFSHVYFYNPFPDCVMIDVIRNLKASLRGEAPIIIYKHPVCHETIIDSGLFVVARDFRFGDHLDQTYRIYVPK